MAAIRRLTNLFDRFVGRKIRKDCLDRLPNDILLDVIISEYLDVVDIIRLRQVSKLYYELTYQPVLWKRLLRKADVPLPPLPPSSRHTPDRMTGLEAERLLCRAYSLDLNWRRSRPRCLHQWAFDAYHRVLEIALLPGGRYLVASVSDFTGQRYSLVVYALDSFSRSRPIAKTDTGTKAYGLRAKYVTIKGQKSVAIAYIRREYHHKTDKRKAEKGQLCDVSYYSTYHPIDPEIEFRYECFAIHTPLSALEALADLSRDLDPAQFLAEARQLPRPFENLVCIRSGPAHPLMCPDIEELFDSAYLAVVKGPRDIVFKRLEGGPSATITCMPEAFHWRFPHTIKAIRFLPHESSVFVVREIDVPRTHEQRCPIYACEKYPVIPAGPTRITQLRGADDCILISDAGRLTHVYVSDPHVPPRGDDSIVGKLRGQAAEPAPPPPISIYGRRVDEEGFVCVRFFAERIELDFPPTPPSAGAVRRASTQVVYRHTLAHGDIFEKDSHLNENLRVVPGVLRPLMVYSPWDDRSDAPRILEIRPWIDIGMLRPYQMEEDGLLHPERGLRRLAIFEDNPWQNLRAAAIAWDETIGRLVIAPTHTDELCVYEFAYAPRQDEEGQRLPLPLPEISRRDVFPRSGDRLLDIDMY
ncbi:hypothetical protein BV20DRAFT_960081 [Pilatotrama ljubarskyi]|nr:hypothetical protein BV20DRAFT_960081 [Pilatotrama ljubarskyi]